MITFSDLWYNEVKRLANACVVEPKFVQIMSKTISYEPTNEERRYLATLHGKYIDLYGIFHIAEMIKNIEKAIIANNRLKAKEEIVRVIDALESPIYRELFKGHEFSEEWKTRVALKLGLKKLLNVSN